MKVEPRKRRGAAQMKAALRIVTRVLRRAASAATGSPRPRKRIDRATAQRAMAEALKIVSGEVALGDVKRGMGEAMELETK
jgi:hypothetical protein